MKSEGPLPVLALTIEAALSRLPVAAARRLGLSPCVGCAVAPFETVREAARILGLDPDALGRALERHLAKEGARR